MRTRLLVMVMILAAGLSGCANKRAIPGLTTPNWALATPAPLPKPPVPTVSAKAGIPVLPVNPFDRYTLDSGDRVRVTVFGQDNLSRVYSVDPGGYISMPLAGGMRVRDLTTFQIESAITSRLRNGYVKDPKVTVEIDTYRPFFILGEVKKAGQFPYVNGLTVEAAVAIAEGYTDRASLRKMRLTRRFGGVQSTVMVPPDYPVMPGDTIYVIERFF
jgi:polysaccharide biosynthesis/export protein